MGVNSLEMNVSNDLKKLLYKQIKLEMLKADLQKIQIEVEAMKADNKQRELKNDYLSYNEDDFYFKVIQVRGIIEQIGVLLMDKEEDKQ